MIEYTNSLDINHRLKKTSAANAVRIESITSKDKKEKDASHIRCQKCKAINTLDGDDLLGHFCDGPDRIRHEENCVIEIHYNRNELSGFQLELNIS